MRPLQQAVLLTAAPVFVFNLEATVTRSLVRFVLLPGRRHGSIGVPPLIEGAAFGALLGDRAPDFDWLRAGLDARGAAAAIPPKANRRTRFRPRH